MIQVQKNKKKEVKVQFRITKAEYLLLNDIVEERKTTKSKWFRNMLNKV